jgi:hypothetical protein
MGILLKRVARDHELYAIEALFRFQRNGRGVIRSHPRRVGVSLPPMTITVP